MKTEIKLNFDEYDTGDFDINRQFLWNYKWK